MTVTTKTINELKEDERTKLAYLFREYQHGLSGDSLCDKLSYNDFLHLVNVVGLNDLIALSNYPLLFDERTTDKFSYWRGVRATLPMIIEKRDEWFGWMIER